MRLTLAPSIDPSRLTGALACYRPSGARCPIRTASGVTTATTSDLPSGRTMTVAIGFAPGTVADPGGAGLDAADLAPVGLGVGGGLLTLALLWLIIARRRAGQIGEPLVAQSTPPADLSPAQAACLLGRPERAITAELLNQAVLGSIQLYWEDKRIRAKHVGPLVFPRDGDRARIPVAALRTVFDGKLIEGNEVYDVAAAIKRTRAQRMVKAYARFTDYAANGLWNEGFRAGRVLPWLIFAGSGVLALIMVPRASVPVTLVSVGALIVAAAVIRGLVAAPRLSEAGRAEVAYLRGLQLFIRTADTHRLEVMQSARSTERGDDDAYALYEKLLGWAVALGVEDSWRQVIGGLPATGIMASDSTTGSTGRTPQLVRGRSARAVRPPSGIHLHLDRVGLAVRRLPGRVVAVLGLGVDQERDQQLYDVELEWWWGGWSSGSSGGSSGGGFSGGGGGGGGGGW